MELETSKNTTNSAAARKRKGNGDQKASAADDAPLVAGKIFAQFITRDGDKTGTLILLLSFCECSLHLPFLIFSH